MPCSDGSCHDNGSYEIGQLNRKVNELTRLLCMACTTISEMETIDPELAAWKMAHDRDDRARIERELTQMSRDRDMRIARMKEDVELMESRMAADKAKAAAYRAELEKLEGKS